MPVASPSGGHYSYEPGGRKKVAAEWCEGAMDRRSAGALAPASPNIDPQAEACALLDRFQRYGVLSALQPERHFITSDIPGERRRSPFKCRAEGDGALFDLPVCDAGGSLIER